MGDQVYSDGIGAISVIGGTVRLDLVVLSPTEREANGQPKTVFLQRVVMSLDGFQRSAIKIQEAMQALSNARAGAFAPVPPAAFKQPEQAPAAPVAVQSDRVTPDRGEAGAPKPPFP